VEPLDPTASLGRDDPGPGGAPASFLGRTRLVDQHCHGVLRDGAALDRTAFEGRLTEAVAPPPDASLFDSAIGHGLRRWCAPVLDLPAHAPPEEYLGRRAELGTSEVTRRFLRAAGVATFCVDTGYRGGDLLAPAELAAAAGAGAVEITRLENLAEMVIGAVDAHGTGFADAVRALVATHAPHAVAFKSIAAYRAGLRLPGPRPSEAEVAAAARSWREARDAAPGTPPRLADATLCAFLIWTAADTGLPIQIHTGLGDADLELADGDPLLLTPLIRALDRTGAPLVLLHCYPFHRHAAYLAQVYPRVYLDLGLTLHNVGFRAADVIAETMELAPFGKLLFASDGFGLPETHFLGAVTFRAGMSRVLADGVAAGHWTTGDAERVAELVAAGNARRLYGL
jgi:uncharacterized protein